MLFGAKANAAIKAGEYWRLLTPIFLHIGVLHLIFNQYALSIFGREMETIFGTARFAAIYLLSGLFGSLASFAFNPVISAGASGAIFGIIGAMAAFFLRNRQTLGQMGRDQLRSLLVLIGFNLFLGTAVSGIDNWGHIGGLISGIVLGLLLAPTYTFERLPAPPFARSWKPQPGSGRLLGFSGWVARPLCCYLPRAPARPVTGNGCSVHCYANRAPPSFVCASSP